MEKKYHPTKRLVPEYIRNLKPYQAGKPIEELAREKGLDKIVKLASNENPLGPSPLATKEMTNTLWSMHRYPDMHAFKLKKALSGLYNLEPKNIILGNGSEGIMAYITRTFLQPGDEVLTSENSFIGFTILARKAGTKLVRVPLTPDYRYDVQALADKVNENTKIIYIANPNNPTGTYITKSEFDYLMEVVPRHTLVILDEAYFEFASEEKDYPDSMDYRYDHVITLRTFSKAYGIAGVRLGYGFAHDHLIENLNKVRLPFEPSLIAQAGACGALQDQSHLARTISLNTTQYERVFKYLTDKEFKPIRGITNFIAFKTGSADASDYLYESLLNLGLIIRPLKSNEMPEYVRVSIGTEENTDYFFECMDKVLVDYDQKFGRPS